MDRGWPRLAPSPSSGVVRPHAFVDESVRGGVYLVGAVIVAPERVHSLRRDMRSLLLPGQRELHMKRESERRQRLVAQRIVAAGVSTQLYVAALGPRRGADARAACVSRLVADLVDCRAERLVLDSRTSGQDKLDEGVIRGALGGHPHRRGLRYEHVHSETEPLLWIADVVAWCHGRGGDWRRRIAPAISCVTDCST